MRTLTVTGVVLDEQVAYSLQDISTVCGAGTEWVIELVEEGILRPSGARRTEWQFPGSSLHTAMRAYRLQHDLGLNLPGVALALELLDEIDDLRSRINTLENLLD